MFELPKLPYGYAALEPVIGARTMLVHYNELHRGYVQRLNKIVSENPRLQGLTLLEILNLAKRGSALAHNAGGHFNHSLLWQLMTRVSESGDPLIATLELMVEHFGALAAFREAFEGAARSLDGSGWCWAALTPEGELIIVTLENQETLIPLSFHPLFGIDLWEHAYLFDYNAKRSLYITRFWGVINWSAVEQLANIFLMREGMR